MIDFINPAFITQPIIKGTIPHSTMSFTQGLLFSESSIYEISGIYGSSQVCNRTLHGNIVISHYDLDYHHWGEGIAQIGNHIVGATWEGGVLYRWKPGCLSLKSCVPFEGETWGLTSLGELLFKSNGSHIISIFDGNTLAFKGSISVTMEGNEVAGINDIQYANGYIWANIWTMPYIVKIDISSANVVQVIDMSCIVQAIRASHKEDVLNGVAWNYIDNTLIVTGKRWPLMFEIYI